LRLGKKPGNQVIKRGDKEAASFNW